MDSALAAHADEEGSSRRMRGQPLDHSFHPHLDEDAGRVVVRMLASVLDRLVAQNLEQGRENPTVSKFRALRPPGININDYLERIFRYASCSGECFVLALVYIDRLIERRQFILTGLNIHRIIITSVMLAAKFFDDQYFNNAYYAKVGGVPCNEMNSLELEFLFLVNFSLHVTPEVFRRYSQELQAQGQLGAAAGGAAGPPIAIGTSVRVGGAEGAVSPGTQGTQAAAAAAAVPPSAAAPPAPPAVAAVAAAHVTPQGVASGASLAPAAPTAGAGGLGPQEAAAALAQQLCAAMGASQPPHFCQQWLAWSSGSLGVLHAHRTQLVVQPSGALNVDLAVRLFRQEGSMPQQLQFGQQQPPAPQHGQEQPHWPPSQATDAQVAVGMQQLQQQQQQQQQGQQYAGWQQQGHGDQTTAQQQQWQHAQAAAQAQAQGQMYAAGTTG
jgi:hypothetical protein